MKIDPNVIELPEPIPWMTALTIHAAVKIGKKLFVDLDIDECLECGGPAEPPYDSGEGIFCSECYWLWYYGELD